MTPDPYDDSAFASGSQRDAHDSEASHQSERVRDDAEAAGSSCHRESQRADRRQERDERHRERHERHRARRERHRERRKERVLHTRISEQLAEDIRKVAEDLRVPVSNIVRNVLEEAFTAVEAVTHDVGNFVEEVLGEANLARERMRRRSHSRRRDVRQAQDPEDRESTSKKKEFPDVLGWQPLILNGPQVCADCSAPLERGERAFLGLSANGGPGVVLCQRCMGARE